MNKENFESIMSKLDDNSVRVGMTLALNFAKSCVEHNNLECLDAMINYYNEQMFEDDETKKFEKFMIQEYDKVFEKE